ncbi:MAG: hypothetical protein AB1486_00225 [Planctomycetota bacterium]
MTPADSKVSTCRLAPWGCVRSRALAASCLFALAAASGSCSARASRPFCLVRFNLEGETEVLLNQTLLFEFNREVSAYSVGGLSSAIRIVSTDGHEAQGEYAVARTTVRFQPRLASRPDLEDGGLLPGRTYKVVIRGGLALDATQAVAGGERLPQTLSFRFTTVPASATVCYVDPKPEARPLEGERLSLDVVAGEPFNLRFAKFLDPRTVLAQSVLVRRNEGLREGVPLRVATVKLHHEASGSVLTVTTDPPPESDVKYTMKILDAVRDLGQGSCAAAVTFLGRSRPGK